MGVVLLGRDRSKGSSQVSRQADFEQRFGKGTLQAASQVEFNAMTQGSEESLEQLGGGGLWKSRSVLYGREFQDKCSESRQSYSSRLAARIRKLDGNSSTIFPSL